MKKVKSIAELKQLALKQGGSVAVGNSRFNMTGEKITLLERPAEREQPAAPAPSPPKQEPPPKIDMQPVADAIERGQVMQAQLMQSMAVAITQMKADRPVTEWEFTVNRNPDGTVASIRAKAIQ